MQIEKNWVIPYPVHEVYRAWTSSDTVIPPATRMEVQAVVGGHYRLFMETPEFTGRNEGRFLQVDAEKSLTYTWEWNGDGEVTEINVTFEPTPTGDLSPAKTLIRLLHKGFTREESLTDHDSGWESYVEGFVAYLGESSQSAI